MYKIYDLTIWFHNEAGDLVYEDRESIAFNEDEAKQKAAYYFDNVFSVTCHGIIDTLE